MNSRSQISRRQSRRICFIGGTRYSAPLDATAARKFETLAPLGEFLVIGFADSLRPRRFSAHSATFYLLPGRLWPVLRYALFVLAGPVLCAWCVFARGARIVVAQSPYEAAAAAVVKALARVLGRRVALIVESHGDFEYRFRGPFSGLMKAWAILGIRSADLLRAVSERTGQQLQGLAGGRGIPLTVFHTWTDLDVFFAAGADRRPGNSIVYAGVLTPLKGVDVLIDAFAAASDGAAKLLIVGRPVDSAYVEGLRRRAKDAGLESRVHFLDHVPQDVLARRLAEARACVLPSRSEGLPRVILDAMAVGTPVVAAAVGGVPELIADGLTGWLVPPGDVPALADRLRWIAAHPHEAETVGRRGRDAVRRRFSVAAYRQGYAELFGRADELLGTSRRKATASIQPGNRRG